MQRIVFGSPPPPPPFGLASGASAGFARFSQTALAAASDRIEAVARAAGTRGHVASGSSAQVTAAGAAALAAALATPQGQAGVRDFVARAGRFIERFATSA